MTALELRYRRMEIGDVKSIMQIENQVYQYPWTHGIFCDCIRVGYDCWLLYLDKALIGHAVVSIAAGESHILNISVAAEKQGQGIGQQFIEFLVGIAKDKKATVIMLEVRPSNLRAINCYNGAGFNEIGCRKDYYPAPCGKEDALLFARQIG